MSEKLKELMEKAQHWPQDAQEEAVVSLQFIEQEISDPYELSEEDKVAIDRGLVALKEGRVASEEEVEKLFAKYR